MFDADSAEKAAEMGEAVILVRVETSPEDIHGMHAAQGILTALGGIDRKSTRLNSSHLCAARMPATACNRTLLLPPLSRDLNIDITVPIITLSAPQLSLIHNDDHSLSKVE